MARKKGKGERRAPPAPEPAFALSSLLSFVEMEGFADDWRDLRLSDDLMSLQVTILSRPTDPPVIPGTGALRKIRFAPAGWSKGKSGAVRVCYVYFPE